MPSQLSCKLNFQTVPWPRPATFPADSWGDSLKRHTSLRHTWVTTVDHICCSEKPQSRLGVSSPEVEKCSPTRTDQNEPVADPGVHRLLIRELSTQHPLPVCWFLSDKDQRKQNKAPTQIHLGVINSALSETTDCISTMFHYTAIVFLTSFSLVFFSIPNKLQCFSLWEFTQERPHGGLTEKKDLLAPDISSWLLIQSILWGVWRDITFI